ncbi:MAG: histidine kinase [Deltaproteobacteria bacterium]|nr:histidine kinase [Deltaproteobacteria bacterium]
MFTTQMRPNFFGSLRIRLIFLILMAVVPTLAVMLYTAWEQRQLDVSHISEKVAHLAKLEAREERQILEGGRQILEAMAHFLESSKGDSLSCASFFAGLLQHYHRYANLGAVKPDGHVFCSAVPLLGPTDASDRIWFQRTLQSRQFAFGDYQIGRITEKPVLVLSCPAFSADGGILAVVFAALKLEWLNRLALYEEADLPAGTTITKMDSTGVVLGHQPGPGDWSGRQFPLEAVRQAVLKQGSGLVEATDSEGISRLYVFESLMSGWEQREVYLILGVPKKIALANSNRILFRNLTGMGIIALAALLATWFGAEKVILKPVKAMVMATSEFAAGKLNARTGLSGGHDELNQLAFAIDQMAERLEQRQMERDKAEREIRNSREQLRNLSAHLQSVREEERTRMAREIHDELGQSLTALKMDISWLNRRFLEEDPAFKKKLASMEEVIDSTIQTVQKLSGELRPGILDDLGLAAAIEWQAEEFQNRTGIECEISLSPEESVLTRDQSTTMFRIFQETLTNVIRHARATKVEVWLEERKGRIVLEVTDNGRGITEAEISDPKSFGLIGMRERVEFIDGEITILGYPGKGTRITVTLPLMV